MSNIKYIPLTGGLFAAVDELDFERASLVTWTLHKTHSGVYVRCFSGENRGKYLHHFILPPGPGQEVDHRDRNGLNNTRENLRICSGSQNMMNRAKEKGCSSIYKGVYWDRARGKWSARAGTRKNLICCGRFEYETEAALAYDRVAKYQYGEFARLNFPRGKAAPGKPTFLFAGPGRAGKDVGAQILAKLTGLRYAGSFSWAAIPFIADFLKQHPMKCWEERHQNRQLWKDRLDYIRDGDETLLAELALATGEIAAGIRDRKELSAVKEAGLFTRIFWIERPGIPEDPTLTFTAADCDEIIVNYGTLDQYKSTLFQWAERNGLIPSLCLSGRIPATTPTDDQFRE